MKPQRYSYCCNLHYKEKETEACPDQPYMTDSDSNPCLRFQSPKESHQLIMSLKFTSNNFFGGDIKKLYLESFVKKFQEHKEIQLQNTLPVKTLNGSLFYF